MTPSKGRLLLILLHLLPLALLQVLVGPGHLERHAMADSQLPSLAAAGGQHVGPLERLAAQRLADGPLLGGLAGPDGPRLGQQGEILVAAHRRRR